MINLIDDGVAVQMGAAMRLGSWLILVLVTDVRIINLTHLQRILKCLFVH